MIYSSSIALLYIQTGSVHSSDQIVCVSGRAGEGPVDVPHEFAFGVHSEGAAELLGGC